MRISDWSSDVCSSDLTAAAVMAGGDCDLLFLGRMPAGDRQRLNGWVRGRAVLTITDDDPACLYGAMFCLVRKPAGLGFSAHLGAIGRGPLRVDPDRTSTRLNTSTYSASSITSPA